MTIMISYTEKGWGNPLRGRRAILKRALLVAILAGAVTLAGCSLFGFLDSIDIQVNGQTASTVDFGSVVLTQSSSPVTGSIVNKGPFPLTVGGASAVSVRVAPSGGGGSSSFAVSGTGASQGQIAVTDAQAASISNGSTYAPAGTYYLGYTFNFTITNSDPSNTLGFTSTPVSLSSPDGSYSIASQPTDPVAASGGTTTFGIQFSSTDSTNAKTCTVTIGNTATGTYSFTITATSTGMGS